MLHQEIGNLEHILHELMMQIPNQQTTFEDEISSSSDSL
jgi:hypothetical protein